MKSGAMGWLQLPELGLAFVLSSLIGLERAMRGRDAGLRTYALVGVGAALFLLVGKYGLKMPSPPGVWCSTLRGWQPRS